MLLLIVALLFALALSALASAAELAYFSLGDSRIRALAEAERRGSAALVQLIEHPERLLLLLRLIDVGADLAAAGLGAALGFQLGGANGMAVGLVAAAACVVLFGELAPWGRAVRRPAGVALALAPGLLFFSRLLGPLLGVIERLSRTAPGAPAASEAAAGEAGEPNSLEYGEELGGHERQLIERAFRLDGIKAWDIMTPRVDIFAWRDSQRLAEIAPQLWTVPYSRVPVYGESIDDVTGVLYLRDAYQALLAGQRDVPLRALAREPLIVPGSVPVMKLLRDFQNRRIHLALVLDEYGGTDGLVTLEDVLEELVGEIEDETDVTEEPILRVSRHEIIAAGDADLREVNHVFNASLPQLEHRSLNGFLLEEFGHVPEAGESLERDGIVIEVLDATETQVLRARLERIVAAAESEPMVEEGESAEAARQTAPAEAPAAPAAAPAAEPESESAAVAAEGTLVPSDASRRRRSGSSSSPRIRA
ncbi:MAG TPA: hemolysin family protein [Longimicrobiales bacterium]